MSTTSITDWKTFVPASKVDKRQGYFEIPAFDYDVAWDGASRIVVQYNYTAPRNFTIFRNLTKPANPNFVPCIKYRVDDTVYRYKLWDDANCTVQAELYVSQLIKKNFCIEIWNLSDETTVSYALVQQFLSSILEVYTDIRVHSNYKAATESDPVDDELLIPTVPAATLEWIILGTLPDGTIYPFGNVPPVQIIPAGSYQVTYSSGAFFRLLDNKFYVQKTSTGLPWLYFDIVQADEPTFAAPEILMSSSDWLTVEDGFGSLAEAEAYWAGSYSAFNLAAPKYLGIRWINRNILFDTVTPANRVSIQLKMADWALPITFGNPSAWLNNV